MSTTALLALIARCRALRPSQPPATDAELLRRFTRQRDAAAFEELIERYAPLVWGVCRRILADESDGEDAFQATFLALIQQAGALDGSRPLGGWLHTVAVRVAQRTLSRSRRQRVGMDLPERATPGDIVEDVSSRELFRAIDAEIAQLPAVLRVPIVLCCLEGRTRDEAAEHIGCSVAAVKSRLERGRNALRRRLTRRGIGLPAAFLVLGLTTGRVRGALRAKVVALTLRSPAPAIAALAQEGLRSLAAGTLKRLAAGLAALLMAVGAAGAIGHALTAQQPETPEPPPLQAAAASVKPEPPPVRVDRHGDPLPEDAIARLGTVRWRHGFYVASLSYSPDGKKIAAVGCGRDITLWDAATGKEIHPFPNKGDQPHSLAFSPDGKILATGGRPCHLWDVATGKELRQFGSGQVAFSPDGKLVATEGDFGPGYAIQLWDPTTGKELRCIECGSANVCGLVFSPDGKAIASSHLDGSIRLWDLLTGKEQRKLSGHQKAAWRLVFSPDGKQMVSSSEDETIRLWDTTNGRQVRIIGEKLGTYSSMPIAWSPDGSLLASGHRNGLVRLWDMATGAEKRRWRAGALTVRAVAFSPDGKTLASAAVWESIRQWDVATGQEKFPTEEHRGFIESIRFSADGAKLTSISRDRCVLEWDLATRKPHALFPWAARGFSRIALAPDGDTVAAADGQANEVRLGSIRTGKPGRVLGKTKDGIVSLAFSPDGRLLALGVEKEGIHIWDVRDGKEVRRIKGVESQEIYLCFSPDSKRLACGFWKRGQRTLHLWEVDSGKEKVIFPCFDTFAGPLAFSPDGKVLAVAANNTNRSGDSLVYLWDTATGEERTRHLGHKAPIRALAFSPDGKLVASGAGNIGTRDNSVHVWEAATGRLIRRFEGHHSCVSSVSFSPDGLTVASGAGDSTILLWDITGRRPDGRWHGRPLTARQLEACWSALADEDASKAYEAVWTLTAAPKEAVPFLQKQLPPVTAPDADFVARRIADLDSDSFRVRQRAMTELRALGDAAAPALRRALEGKPDLEMRRRLQQLLDQTKTWNAKRLRELRAIQTLEHIGTRQARDVLNALASGEAGTFRTEEARAALKRGGTEPRR